MRTILGLNLLLIIFFAYAYSDEVTPGESSPVAGRTSSSFDEDFQLLFNKEGSTQFDYQALTTKLIANAPSADTVLETLEPSHPRLLMTELDLAKLKSLYPDDTALQRIVRDTIAEADEYREAPRLEHKLDGPRLLSVSRECLDRVYTLCAAYRWTGETKYARAAKNVVLDVCDFPDWNPSHFLDTAEMSHAVAIGYDWLYEYLGETNRGRIADRLEVLGIDPVLEAYRDNAWWTTSEYNWNMVCNGGMAIAALAIAEEIPEKAATIIANATRQLPYALASYAPRGVWDEGPSYWHYATSYVAYALSAFESALGTTFGLTEIEGLDRTGYFPVYLTGPTRYYFNFADVQERSRRYNLPCLMWLARTYDNTFFSDAEHAKIAERGGHATHLMWYVPQSPDDLQPPLYHSFPGKVPIYVERSSWNDPNATWFAIKAGYNQVNHGHLDLGSFEIDALGERWVRDLGSDDYNLPGYWENGENGQRWDYYRLNSFSHNVPIIGGKGQNAKATAEYELQNQFIDGESVLFPQIYTENAYPGSIFQRGIRIVKTNQVEVRDMYIVDKGTDVLWGITTDAEITLTESGVAILKLNGKQMRVTAKEPSSETPLPFNVSSAEQDPPQKRNESIRRLEIKIEEGGEFYKSDVERYLLIVTFEPLE